MKFCSLSLVVASSLLLTSCGGSSGGGNGTTVDTQDVTFGSSITGQFVDAPVKGLNYYINGDSSNPSTTGSNGSFSCKVGEYVTFRLGTDLVLGTAACGSIVAPTFFRSNSNTRAAATIAAILQNIGGGAGVSELNVFPVVGTTFSVSSVDSITTLGALNNVLTAAGASTVTDYDQALDDAEEAMNSYLSQNIQNIPEEYMGKEYIFDVTADRVSGTDDLCDQQTSFRAVARTANSGSSVTFFPIDDDGTVSATPIIDEMPLYSTKFHVLAQVSDEDETYFINGAGSFNDKGFSGSFSEIYPEGTCGYSFSNVAPESDDEPGESDAE